MLPAIGGIHKAVETSTEFSTSADTGPAEI